MRPGEHGERQHPLGMSRREHPGHLSAPVVTDEMEARRSPADGGAGEVQHVRDQPFDPVGGEIGGSGTDTGRVAALVGRDHAEAGASQRRHLMPPRVTRLGKAVQHDHQRPVARTGDLGGEPSFRRDDRVGRVHGRVRATVAQMRTTREPRRRARVDRAPARGYTR